MSPPPLMASFALSTLLLPAVRRACRTGRWTAGEAQFDVLEAALCGEARGGNG
jgi:hypothetical protein